MTTVTNNPDPNTNNFNAGPNDLDPFDIFFVGGNILVEELLKRERKEIEAEKRAEEALMKGIAPPKHSMCLSVNLVPDLTKGEHRKKPEEAVDKTCSKETAVLSQTLGKKPMKGLKPTKADADKFTNRTENFIESGPQTQLKNADRTDHTQRVEDKIHNAHKALKH